MHDKSSNTFQLSSRKNLLFKTSDLFSPLLIFAAAQFLCRKKWGSEIGNNTEFLEAKLLYNSLCHWLTDSLRHTTFQKLLTIFINKFISPLIFGLEENESQFLKAFFESFKMYTISKQQPAVFSGHRSQWWQICNFINIWARKI